MFRPRRARRHLRRAGAGKSTLLEAIVAGSSADATVVALIGERGREAERWLGRVGPRTNIVCATADRAAAERLRAAEAAFAQADALRARGLHVLLVLDSLARVAAAARDVGDRGRRAGRARRLPALGRGPPGAAARVRRRDRAGSITLVATVLSEGPLEHDPVAEAARAALDGHLVLSPRLAAAGWFPAIDLPASASRTLADVATPAHRAAAASCGRRWRRSTARATPARSGLIRAPATARSPAPSRRRAGLQRFCAGRRAAATRPKPSCS